MHSNDFMLRKSLLDDCFQSCLYIFKKGDYLSDEETVTHGVGFGDARCRRHQA